MALYKKVKLTTLGKNLLNDLMNSSLSLEFTGMKTADRLYLESEIESLTTIEDVKQSASVYIQERMGETTTRVESLLSNENLTESYQIQSIGVYAKDIQGQEVLVGVAIAEEPFYMYSHAEGMPTAAIFNLHIGIGDTELATLETNPSGVARLSDVVRLDDSIKEVAGSVTTLNTELTKVEEGILDLEEKDTQLESIISNNKKDSDQQVGALTEEVDKKADKTEVNELANLKADKTYVDEEDAKLTAQLAQTAEHESYNAMTYHTGNSLSPKAFVTFVDDDGSVDVLTKLKPLFVEKGVPCVIAAIGNPEALPSMGPKMSFAEMKDLQDTHGWEIASHSVNHHSYINIADDHETIRYEARESKRILESNGLKIDNFVYPFNASKEYSREVTSAYYDSGTSGGNSINTKPISSYMISRVPLGSSNSNTSQLTFEYYKSKVDEAIESNGWCVFMLHCWNPEHDETQQQHLSDIIDYCLANGVEIGNIRDGLKIFGNKFEIEEKLSITNSGEIIDHNPEPVYKVKRDESILHNSPITAFEKGTITHTTINGAKQQSLPVYGSMVTFRTHDLDDTYSYQYLYSAHSQYHRIYHRRWINGTWSDFIDLAPKGVTVTVPDINVGVIDAGKTKTVSVPVGIALTGKPYTLNIVTGFDEVIFSHSASGSSAKVTFYNTFSGQLDVGTRTATVYLPTQ